VLVGDRVDHGRRARPQGAPPFRLDPQVGQEVLPGGLPPESPPSRRSSRSSFRRKSPRSLVSRSRRPSSGSSARRKASARPSR
jgi:hypothetical protein